MQVSELLHRALRYEWLTPEEGVFLFENAATAELMYVGNAMRQHHVPGNVVTWIIDRNSNTTNVCIANCKFCNFYRRPGHLSVRSRFSGRSEYLTARQNRAASQGPDGGVFQAGAESYLFLFEQS